MDDYSVAERAKCAAWYEWLKSPVEVQRLYHSEYGKNARAPDARTIKRWHTNLLTSGSVVTVKRDRSSSERTEQNVERVVQHFEEDPNTSTRRASNALQVSRRTIQRILHDYGWHPYKVQVVQRLHEEDLENRMEFAEQELQRIQANPSHLVELTWSDEAHFHLDGGVNRHNCRYWANQNPHWIKQESMHSPRTTVWAAISQSGIYGPFFFDTSVNKDRYLKMLQEEFWPAVQSDRRGRSIIFMQDGAPPHWGLPVREWLNKKMPNRWMGRGSPNMPWPPRSPDLTPCDFFLWGFVKSKVYHTRPTSMQDLKDRIIQAFQEVTTEMCRETALAYQKRLESVLENGGGHVEVR